MSLGTRPNPDELLARVQAEEQRKKHGRLKLFLGYAAGVGKTYAMLEAAHQRQGEGIDVVIGYIETHGRAETEALCTGLETIPRHLYSYRGIELTEMDIDAVLRRRPQLVLVDELAHSNVPGARHAKRYLDVEELLEAGIDVYTTLNIQHLESLNDVIAQITGMKVRETVPDRIVDAVTDIELVDLPPEELLDRLKEGKVYVPEQAERAIEKFFRAGNLTALRELTMRRAAERVDDQMRAYMQTRAIPGPWPASERLLVCVGPGGLSERLIRSARRLADELNAEWFAINVEISQQTRISQGQRDQIARILQLAEELGAKSITLPGRSIVDTVIDYARRHNVTKIIIGKSLRYHWNELFQGSLVDQLIRASGSIDVYVVSGTGEESSNRESVETWKSPLPWRKYLLGLGLVLAAMGVSALVYPYISPTNLVVIFLLSVVLAALYLGRGPATMVSILGVVAFDFFFVPPRFTMAVADTEYLLTFAGLLAVGLVISQLANQVRKQAEEAKSREAQTAALYELSRELTVAAGLEAVARTIITHISQTFSREVAIFLPEEGSLKTYATSPGLAITENELAVAAWSYKSGKLAGRGTDTLPEATMRYQPLKTPRGVVGVVGVKPFDPSSSLTHDQRRLLDSLANQVALAIERARLVEQARRTELMEITEKLQTALLNSISHDLRTPLVTITGALSSLSDEATFMDEEARRSLVQTAREEADRLNRLVGNLLDMTRLEAGALRLNLEPCEVQDVIGAALAECESVLGERKVDVDIASELPLIPMDFVLIQRVLVNVFDNALKYSPPDSAIEIRVTPSNAFLEISIGDRGMGIPAEDLARIFDKFYRVHHPGSVSGTGLGLSICKGIVEAHGGFIGAENRQGGGTLITVALPLG